MNFEQLVYVIVKLLIKNLTIVSVSNFSKIYRAFAKLLLVAFLPEMHNLTLIMRHL